MTTATNPDGTPRRRRSLLPREHGAWAELGFPALSALLLGRGTLPAVLLSLATVAVFLAHEPVLVWLGLRGSRARREHGRRAAGRALALVTVAMGAGFTGLWLSPVEARWSAALPAGLAALLAVFVVRRAEKTVAGELVAAFALTSPALPIALANGVPTPVAWSNVALWGGLAVCATLSVRAVIAKLKPTRRGQAKRLRAVAVALGGGVSIAGGVAAALGAIQVGLAVAIVPAALFAAALAWRRPHPRHLKRIGFALMGVQIWALVALLGVFL